MAKIFTIAEGLENLGALKSGGQGSVYKARKTGEIITAIKILPTPIASENDDDKHFISFRNAESGGPFGQCAGALPPGQYQAWRYQKQQCKIQPAHR